MSAPAAPRIYHIVHVDRLASIVADGNLWCDVEIVRRRPPGTAIGMDDIKRRRLEKLYLNTHPDLHVGDCVPFYFCPRSVMLYVDPSGESSQFGLCWRAGSNCSSGSGFEAVGRLGGKHNLRWAFTLSNAGASYFEDRCHLTQLEEIDWEAVQAQDWQECKEGKQAEFLIERRFPWRLVERIGIRSQRVLQQTTAVLRSIGHKPRVEIRDDWYY